MFEWLEQEIGKINTRCFHVVGGPAGDAMRAAIEGVEVPLPRSYKEFVVRFGNAKLYKAQSGWNAYLVGVWAPLIKEESGKGEDLYGIGHYQSSTAYLKGPLLHAEGEPPVFEGYPSRQVKVADGFEEWLIKRCKAARRMYGKQKWAEILAGPAPFTPQELRIIEARRKFTWHVVGTTPDRTFLFEVHNGSKMVLPYLTIEVRRKDGSPYSGIGLPVADIQPGQTAVVEADVYAKWMDPWEIELVPEPDPEPEDRDYFWEFKPLPT